MRYVTAGILCGIAFVLLLTNSTIGGDGKKITIKTVMKEHKKGGLRAKVLKGKASEAERKKLVELYKVACASKAPKGEQEQWVKRWKKIVAAATKVAKTNNAQARKALAKATNCKSCHSLHK